MPTQGVGKQPTVRVQEQKRRYSLFSPKRKERTSRWCRIKTRLLRNVCHGENGCAHVHGIAAIQRSEDGDEKNYNAQTGVSSAYGPHTVAHPKNHDKVNTKKESQYDLAERGGVERQE